MVLSCVLQNRTRCSSHCEAALEHDSAWLACLVFVVHEAPTSRVHGNDLKHN